MQEESGQNNEKKSNLENLWDTALKTAQDAAKSAIQPITCYIQAAQKKIELTLLSRKVAAAQSELGKVIDKARDLDAAKVFENTEVKSSLESLDQLKQTAAKLTNEIEQLQKQVCPEPPPSNDAPHE